MENKVRRH